MEVRHPQVCLQLHQEDPNEGGEVRREMLESLPFFKWNILQVTEKGGYLVFILNEQDLDCAALDMVSQRLEKAPQKF